MWLLVGVAVLAAIVAVLLSLRFCSREKILLPSWAPPTLKEVRAQLEGRTFGEFVDEAYRLHLLRHPQTVTDLGLAEKLGVRNDRLDDYSDGYVRTTQAIEREIYRRLHTYNRTALTPDERLTYDACEAFWNDLTTHEAPAISMYPISASDDSPHMRLYARLISVWRLADEEDVADYIACLHQADRQLLQLRDRIVDLRADRRLPPAVALDTVLIQIQPLRITKMWSPSEYLPDRIVANPNPYFVALRERVLAMPEIGYEKRVAYLTEARSALEQEVIPAYEKLNAALVAALTEAPEADIGINQRAGGNAVYEGLLRHYTESDLGPAAIHAAGQETVARLQKEIDAIEDRVKAPSDRGLPDTATGVKRDGGAPSPDDVVAACRAVLERAEALTARFAERLPKTSVAILLGEGSRGYEPAPYDGSRPAFLVVSPKKSLTSSDIATLVYREVVPGRHLQMAAARELPLPAIRAWGDFPALQEGWAAYALDVAAEVGLYDSDPLANLERLRSQLRDAASAVVDTGVHAFGWSFDRAFDYYVAATGDEERGAHMVVKGCIGSPGRATAALVGVIRLRALRDSVERARGVAFDPVAFYDALLGHGLLPLSLVEWEVRQALEISDHG